MKLDENGNEVWSDEEIELAKNLANKEHIEPSKPWPRPEAKIDTGGPASDKTLRDYFATHATGKDLKIYLDTQHTRPEARYKHADAMIKARRG